MNVAMWGKALRVIPRISRDERQVVAQYLKPRPSGPPEWYPQEAWPLWFVSLAFLHNRRYGLLFLAGLIGEVALLALKV